jgi:hypothetical protein
MVIATPAYGETFYTPYVHTIFRLHRALVPAGWSLSFASVAFADIAESRNFLLTHWFDKTDASHLLFLDADMGFEPQLVQEMLALNKPVVGAISPRRQLDLRRLYNIAREGGADAERTISRGLDYIVQPVRGRAAGRQKGFIEVEGCGAGIMLIQRGCIEQMLKKLPQLSDARAPKNSPLAQGLNRLIRAFDPITRDGNRMSEDFSFCHRWRVDCGGQIWASTDRKITHVGMYHFEGRWADASGPRIVVGGGVAAEKAKIQAKVQAKVGVGQAPRVRAGGAGPVVTAGKLQIPKKGDKAPKTVVGKLSAPAKGKPSKH